jgi:hypothetical protein
MWGSTESVVALDLDKKSISFSKNSEGAGAKTVYCFIVAGSHSPGAKVAGA